MNAGTAHPGPSRKLSKPDRRVRKTREALGDALLALMAEKHFDRITVQEVLDRAGVGRATFYAHYSDKNDLLLSDVEQFLNSFSTMLQRTGEPPGRLAPVRELFAHVRDAREIRGALARSGKLNDVHELGTAIFARSIDDILRRMRPELEPARRAASARALAGSLFSLVDWWIDQRSPLSPEEMDELFHRLAWSGLG